MARASDGSKPRESRGCLTYKKTSLSLSLHHFFSKLFFEDSCESRRDEQVTERERLRSLSTSNYDPTVKLRSSSLDLTRKMDNGGHRQIGMQKSEFRPTQEQVQYRPSIKDIMALVSERDAAILERNLALAEKRKALQERDLAILQRDAAIVERDNAIKERDQAFASLHMLENNY